MKSKDNSINVTNKSDFFPAWNTADPLLYPYLKNNRKLLINNITEAEAILWNCLKSKQLGVKFRRQHIIENFIPDFVCLSCKLIIEVDGEIHKFQKKHDEERTKFLNERGYRVLRFKNEEILNEIELVIQKIKENIRF